MPAALRVAGGLGVSANNRFRASEGRLGSLYLAPFLFDRAGSKVNRSPAADSAAGDQRQTSNFRHHVTVFHPSPLHALRRPPAAGLRCGRKRGRGRGRVEPLGGGKIFIFRLFWARANHPFRRPRFFHIRCVRQRGCRRVLVFPPGRRCRHRFFRSFHPHNHTLSLIHI